MTPTEALRHHQSLCDELHQLALEENRFLKQNQRVPDAPLLEKKRALLARLDESLTALKAGNAAASPQPAARPDPLRSEIIEKSRAKLLQILHLDRENEQLLLRYSLGVRPTRPVFQAPPAASTPSPAPTTAPNALQRLYDRHR